MSQHRAGPDRWIAVVFALLACSGSKDDVPVDSLPAVDSEDSAELDDTGDAHAGALRCRSASAVVHHGLKDRLT